MAKKTAILVLLALILALVTGCTQTVSEIKNPEHVGKEVIVKGIAEHTIKLGPLSGFTLKDKEGNSIGVKSDILPKEGSEVTVKGTLIKDTLLGYYINAEKVR